MKQYGLTHDDLLRQRPMCGDAVKDARDALAGEPVIHFDRDADLDDAADRAWRRALC